MDDFLLQMSIMFLTVNVVVIVWRFVHLSWSLTNQVMPRLSLLVLSSQSVTVTLAPYHREIQLSCCTDTQMWIATCVGQSKHMRARRGQGRQLMGGKMAILHSDKESFLSAEVLSVVNKDLQCVLYLWWSQGSAFKETCVLYLNISTSHIGLSNQCDR